MWMGKRTGTRKSIEPRIPRDPTHKRPYQPRPDAPAGSRCDRDSLQRQPILGPQLFQLCNHAIRHARDTLGHEAVHHSLHELNLVLDGEIDEIRVDEDAVGRTEGGVV